MIGGVVLDVSFHYCTEQPEKLIRSFKYREKCALEDIDNMEGMIQYFQETFAVNTRLLEQVQLKQNDLEKVAIIVRTPVLSVFPILETQKQRDNETWIKFDTRPKSLAQKKASLLVMKENENVRMEVWNRGEIQASSDDRDLKLFADFIWRHFAQENVAIQQIEDAITILRTTQKFSQLEKYLISPLFLPTDWETRWNWQAISSHMFLCSNFSTV